MYNIEAYRSKGQKVADVLVFLPVLGGVIELDEPRVELLNQDSDDVHEQQEVDLEVNEGEGKGGGQRKRKKKVPHLLR